LRFRGRIVCTAIAFFQASTAWTQGPPVTPDSGTPAAVAATPAVSPWTKNGIDIYLMGDVYGDRNFNHPESGYNQLYNFDDKANQAHLSFAKVSLEKASGVFGFRVDAGLGRTTTIISGTDDAPDGFKYLEQMFVEFRPPQSHGLQVDFGKFVTSAGAEVIESNSNWNYSRSLLFALAIPYYHFGVRATLPVSKTFTAGVQVVNGWNSLGTNNSFQTVGLVGNFTFKKLTWSNDYYTGPQQEGPVRGYRQLYDTTVVLNPAGKANLSANFDYGSDKVPNGPRQNWSGIAVAGRYQLTNRFAIAPRLELFNDSDGFTTGVRQSVKEVTVTGEAKLFDGLLARLEYRRDTSDKPFYDRGAGVTVAKNQSTVALAFIAFFGPKK